MTARKSIPRVKLDLAKSISTVVSQAQVQADDRFAVADRVLAAQPSALATAPEAQDTGRQTTAGGEGASFDVGSLTVGQVYNVPLSLIDPNPIGARHFYREERVEEIVASFAQGQQDVAANGFVKLGRVELLDGGTRLRAARAAGLATLEVKIDPPPADLRDQFKRSMRLNDERSNHTELDMAVNVNRLLAEGVYPSPEELGKDLDLSKSEVSMYRKIATIPERLLQKMNKHDKTAALTIAYELSTIFSLAEYEAESDKFDRIAEDLIDEIQEKDLSREKVKALMAAKVDGPKSRQRAEATTVRYGEKTGTMKVFASRGQIEVSFRGLDARQLAEVQSLIQKALAGQLPL